MICFFQESTKFKTRYSTLGFNDTAKLDDGSHVAELLRSSPSIDGGEQDHFAGGEG